MSALDIVKKVTVLIGYYLLVAFMIVEFLTTGVIINGIQGVLYLSLYNVSRNLYRKINYYLIYSTWTQIVAMAHWWSGSRVRKWGKKEDIDMFGKEHCLVIMNHKYDIDWLMCWLTCEDLGMLGNAKSCAKKSLKFVPVIGWGWVFGEMIFLERSWDKDKEVLGEKLDSLASYQDPIMILYFCEGTRFTPEKHQASMEFARTHNLPILQHHLSPRTRGFNFTAKHLKNKISAVYDVQLGFQDGALPTFSHLLRQQSFLGDVYIRRIPMSEVPTDSDESTSKWLHELYERKDRIMDDYFKTKKFPGVCVDVKPRIVPVLNVLFWSVLVAYIVYHATILAMTSLIVRIIYGTLLAFCFGGMWVMVGATKSTKGSSYGKDKSPRRSNNNVPSIHRNGNLVESPANGVSNSASSEDQNPGHGDAGS